MPEFTPASWLKAGDAFRSGADDWESRASSLLSSMSVSQLECDKGGTLADGAISMVAPSVLESLTETIAGLHSGFDEEAAAMHDTGRNYESAEHDASASAQEVGR